MAQFGEYMSFNFQAKENLSANQYFAVTIADGKVANSGSEASGILITKPTSGENGHVGHTGEMSYQAGAAIAASARITITTSGYCITATSGTHIVGRNGNTAATSGSIQRGFFHFLNPIYAQESNFLA